MRELEGVASPHNRGKIGSVYLAHHRPRAALPHLQAAAEGEPETTEWHYRLGCALASLRRYEEAEAALRVVQEQDEEYAYGAALLRLIEVVRRRGSPEEALALLDRFERNHGETPESTFRRGQALKALGRRDEARERFAHVAELASKAARYQRQEAGGWVIRAFLARLF